MYEYIQFVLGLCVLYLCTRIKSQICENQALWLWESAPYRFELHIKRADQTVDDSRGPRLHPQLHQVTSH